MLSEYIEGPPFQIPVHSTYHQNSSSLRINRSSFNKKLNLKAFICSFIDASTFVGGDDECFTSPPFFSFDGMNWKKRRGGVFLFEKASESTRKILRNKTSRRLMVRDKESHRSKLQELAGRCSSILRSNGSSVEGCIIITML